MRQDPNRFLDLTRERVIIYDGAMGTSIQTYELDAAGYGDIEGCNENLVFHNPGLIEEIHASFFEVGVDVVETDTFGSSKLKLEEYGLGERTYEQNRTAAELARRIADNYATADRPRFVAGSIGPTGLLPASEDPLLGNAPLRRGGRAVHRASPGLDRWRRRRSPDRDDAGHSRAESRRPRHHTSPRGRRPSRSDPGPGHARHQRPDAARHRHRRRPRPARGRCQSISSASTARPAPSICASQPVTSASTPRNPSPSSRTRALPQNVNGLAVYPLDPEPMARALRQMVEEFGVGLVGGCCGTTPDHLAALLHEVERATGDGTAGDGAPPSSPACCERSISIKTRRP